MAEHGPDYTLRRPVDIHQPLPIVFNQTEEEIGGYYITDDGIASKNPPPPSVLSAVRFSSLRTLPFSFAAPTGVIHLHTCKIFFHNRALIFAICVAFSP